jgi:hypothetical protein
MLFWNAKVRFFRQMAKINFAMLFRISNFAKSKD